jgi:hypothetical protein
VPKLEARTPNISIYIVQDNKEYLVTIDTRASFSLTPNIKDFVGPLRPSTSTLTGLNSVTNVADTRTVKWTIQDITRMVKTI